MPLHKLSLIMVFNVQENAVFIHEFSKISLSIPWEGGKPPPPPTPSPRSVASLPRFGTPLTNPGCTTVTGIAKGTRAHARPPWLEWNNFFKEKGVYRELVLVTSHNQPPNNAFNGWYLSLHITNLLIMVFNVQENAVFIHEFSENLPTVGGGNPHPPPPPLGRFAPSLWPLPCWKILATPVYMTTRPWRNRLLRLVQRQTRAPPRCLRKNWYRQIAICPTNHARGMIRIDGNCGMSDTVHRSLPF